NLGICVYGGKLKFGGSALLPLNAALVCKREKRSYIARSSGKSSKLKLAYRRSISVLTSVVKIQNWHRFNG
ncbi:hypothetical protein P3493_23680, partial [Vibrio parahaemolyticus]|nr:hypothetical protein [Vibrio parahaemolyticus]